ncbi:unnamed protein product [Echinostoma caproni]|uniref:G_PROTEIN_RECEP_F1_2 domain-containing protein n=1 Tax=Echinostoma caproni TaxID=27848 RepID=A0A183BG04_9TREM|nr:unnamed protein product [Echinostoma caproni]
MLITVAILYGLSQLPRHIVYLHGSLHREFWQTSWSVRLWTAVSFTRDSSTCYNPFIYAWVNKNYRHEVYRLLRPLCAPCRLMRKRFTQIYREFRHRGLRETNRHPVTTTNSASLPGTHIRSVFFKDTYDDVRVVNSVPNFGAQAPVLSNCYSVTLPIQNPDTGAVAPIVQHMSMISLSR